MRRKMKSTAARRVAKLLVLAMMAFYLPPAAAFQAPPSKVTHRAPARTRDQRPETRDRVRVLTPAEMLRARGAGEYRIGALAGQRPWHRSFRDVNLCTGNLFKSYTDVQVPGTRGPGLAWQRTYNSQDDRVGPFGKGWMHAYDIRIGEAGNNEVPQTGFLGTQHTYTRDADGLYTPPPYAHVMLESDYEKFMVEGDPLLLPSSDTQSSLDGTAMHYVSEGLDVDQHPLPTRVCDWIKDRQGNQTTLTYQTVTFQDGSTRKRLVTVTDPVGRALQIAWNAATDPADWRITQVSGPLDDYNQAIYTVSYEYDGSGNLWKVHQDPNGLNRTTTFGYTTVEGESGLLSTITDPAGRTMTYVHALAVDGLGVMPSSIWVTDVIEPGPAADPTHWQIFPFAPPPLSPDGTISGSQVLCVNIPTLNPIGIAVDGQLRTTYVELGHIDVSMHGTYLTYDSDFNLTAVDEGIRGYSGWGDAILYSLSCRDRRSVMTYDLAGKLLTQSSPDHANSTTEFEYWGKDKFWQKKTQIDPPLPSGQRPTTQWDYATRDDERPGWAGQLLSVTDSESGSFSYEYNEFGQKTQETNANGVVTTYAYDATLGYLAQVVQDPGTGHLNRTTTMLYDQAGRVLGSTDPMSRTTTFTYNALSQPLTAAFPGETITYTYCSDGQPYTVADNRGTTTMAYETDTGRLQSVTDPVTGQVSYSYDAMGNRASVTLPGGARTEYAYDYQFLIGDQGNLDAARPGCTGVLDDQGREVTYHYNSLGLPDQAFSNKGYDQNQQLCQYLLTQYLYDTLGGYDAAQGVYNSGDPYTRGWLVFVRQTWHYKDQNGEWQKQTRWTNQYTYSNAGQRLTNTITDNTGATRTEQYAYDRLYRLTGVDYGDTHTRAYAFDAMGNRTSYTVDGGTPEGSTFNAANMLLTRGGQSYTNDAAGNTTVDGVTGRQMSWDAQNRMTQCVYNSTTSTFTYGADGLRRRMVVGTNTTDYVLDGQSVVREFVTPQGQQGSYTASYLNGPRGPECKRDAQGVYEWYVYDGLGSVVATVNDAGTVVSSRTYDVYGGVRSGGGGSRHKFVGSLGHASDDETGLLYMRARYMDPATGRFVSEDPAGDGDNWYTYVEDDPVNDTDTTGQFADTWYNAGVVAIGMAALASVLDTITGHQLSTAFVAAAVDATEWVADGLMAAAEAIVAEFAHRKGARGSTWNKHSKPRPGDPEKADPRRRDPPKKGGGGPSPKPWIPPPPPGVEG